MSQSANKAMEQREFDPLPKQREFMMSSSDQVLLSGSFGAGKSRVGNEKGYFMNMMYPGNRGLIVRKHFSDVYSSTIKQTLLEEVIPDSHIHNHNKGEHVIEHYTGSYDDNGKPILSEIHYHGLDSGKSTSDDDLPRKIGSHSYGWIFVDEGTELSKGEWNQLQGRLRYKGKRQGGKFYTVPFQQIFTATNPASPQHWMYKLFFNADNQQDAHAIRMNVKDNPYVPKSYVERMEKNLSGMYYERYFLGKWVGAEGIIYSEYNEDDHLITADYLADPAAPLGEWDIKETESWDYDDEPDSVWINPPDGWRVYRSIDFGYNNPFVCQWWALSPDDELVLFRELYESELLVEDAGRRIKELTSDDWLLENTFADHDAEGNENLKRRGVHTANAEKDVNAGIQSVKNRLRKDDRGRPRLYIMIGSRVHKPDNRLVLDDSPTKTVDEIPSYVWKNDDEEVPRKSDDHGLDAMRYLTYSLDNGPNITLDEMKSLEETVNSAW